MNTTLFHNFSDIATKEVAAGFYSKLIHTDTNTFNFIEVKAGCSIIEHEHTNEQCSFILEGRFELTISGNTQVLDKSTYAIIPASARHSGTALTDCRILDVFSPPREDYKKL